MTDYAFSPEELADPMHDPRITMPCVVPREVSRDELMVALEPLFVLLGIPEGEGGTRAYASPGISIEDDTVTATLAGHVVTDGTARTVKVGAGEHAEWATEVKVRIR